MFKKLTTGLTLVLALAAGGAMAAGGEGHVHDHKFSFEGIFGSYDQNQLQRGLKIYTEVCSACHGLKFVPIRTIADKGGPHLPKDQMRAYAKNLTVFDSTLNGGEGDFREAKASDNFSAVAGAPDLSLMAKARAGFHGPHGTGINQLLKGMGGPEYIFSLLNGYTGKTKEESGKTFYENTAFPGGWISMAPPLSDDTIDAFDDGHATDLKHVSEDIAAFLMWTAEPKLNDRKWAGFIGVLILSLLAFLLYLTNKALWAPVKRRAKGE